MGDTRTGETLFLTCDGTMWPVFKPSSYYSKRHTTTGPLETFPSLQTLISRPGRFLPHLWSPLS